MSEKINQNFKVWSESPFDKETKEETIKLKLNNIENFNDSFYKNLEFGTGGMRGIMGVGPNRVNKYTFGKNTQAISNIINLKREKSSVVIGHDCRNNSRELSLEVANIFSANNIKVFIFDSLKPTPLISYAVRQLDCICGIVLTASHNPPEYNGYKVYWEDGCQVVPPMDKEIIEKINKTDYSSIKFSQKNDLIKILDENIEEEFKKLSIKTARIGNSDRSKLKVVFTALHGTSFKLIPEILKSSGYSDVKLVEDQMIPDGNFTNVNSSNPEDINALEQAIILGKKYDSDIIIGTDPDADRFGIAVKNNNNEYVLINGNQAMVVMTDYLLSKENKLNDKFIASTVVSTPMMDKISELNDIKFFKSLTGFKWIGKMINDYPEMKFIGGGEESFGYLIGDFVRDKDAITSSLLACEICSELKSQNSSFYNRLIECYIKYGFYKERLFTLKKEGEKGADEINKIINGFKVNPPKKLLEDDIKFVEDYASSTKINITTGSKSEIKLPKTNMIIFESNKGYRVAVRPSGTEPKIKYYFSVNTKLGSKNEFELKNIELDNKLDKLIENFTKY
ncbi:MAG: phospho-sugar mutase [Flavobacteriaceae bacterium]|nr:phospho-sugar mutase [Flavobacteriaceae bacterium]